MAFSSEPETLQQCSGRQDPMRGGVGGGGGGGGDGGGWQGLGAQSYISE